MREDKNNSIFIYIILEGAGLTKLCKELTYNIKVINIFENKISTCCPFISTPPSGISLLIVVLITIYIFGYVNIFVLCLY